MDDIGSTDDIALLCHTNEPAARFIVGDWFDPNGNKVGSDSDSKPGDVPGFKRNRVPHVVRLKRSSSYFSKRVNIRSKITYLSLQSYDAHSFF